MAHWRALARHQYGTNGLVKMDYRELAEDARRVRDAVAAKAATERVPELLEEVRLAEREAERLFLHLKACALAVEPLSPPIEEQTNG